MSGVKGAGGPPPKRSSQRRRTNKPPIEVTTAAGAGKVKRPPSSRTWHPVARRWYLSLAESGQAAFYEPSDWMTAFVVAESMSRELLPQPVVTKDGIEMVSMPPKAASIAAWLKAATSLMATEGDRRRLRLELSRPGAVVEEAGDVSWIDDARRRLRSAD